MKTRVRKTARARLVTPECEGLLVRFGVPAAGPAVWTRSVKIPWAERPFSQRETYHRWPPAEIEAPKERFAPRRIAALLRELLENGAPRAPIDAGV